MGSYQCSKNEAPIFPCLSLYKIILIVFLVTLCLSYCSSSSEIEPLQYYELNGPSLSTIQDESDLEWKITKPSNMRDMIDIEVIMRNTENFPLNGTIQVDWVELPPSSSSDPLECYSSGQQGIMVVAMCDPIYKSNSSSIDYQICTLPKIYTTWADIISKYTTCPITRVDLSLKIKKPTPISSQYSINGSDSDPSIPLLPRTPLYFVPQWAGANGGALHPDNWDFSLLNYSPIITHHLIGDTIPENIKDDDFTLDILMFAQSGPTIAHLIIVPQPLKSWPPVDENGNETHILPSNAKLCQLELDLFIHPLAGILRAKGSIKKSTIQKTCFPTDELWPLGGDIHSLDTEFLYLQLSRLGVPQEAALNNPALRPVYLRNVLRFSIRPLFFATTVTVSHPLVGTVYPAPSGAVVVPIPYSGAKFQLKTSTMYLGQHRCRFMCLKDLNDDSIPSTDPRLRLTQGNIIQFESISNTASEPTAEFDLGEAMELCGGNILLQDNITGEAHLQFYISECAVVEPPRSTNVTMLLPEKISLTFLPTRSLTYVSYKLSDASPPSGLASASPAQSFSITLHHIPNQLPFFMRIEYKFKYKLISTSPITSEYSRIYANVHSPKHSVTMRATKTIITLDATTLFWEISEMLGVKLIDSLHDLTFIGLAYEFNGSLRTFDPPREAIETYGPYCSPPLSLDCSINYQQHCNPVGTIPYYSYLLDPHECRCKPDFIGQFCEKPVDCQYALSASEKTCEEGQGLYPFKQNFPGDDGPYPDSKPIPRECQVKCGCKGPSICNGHGAHPIFEDTNICDETQCTCDLDWSGPDCNQHIACLQEYYGLQQCSNRGYIAYDAQKQTCDSECTCFEPSLWEGASCAQPTQCSSVAKSRNCGKNAVSTLNKLQECSQCQCILGYDEPSSGCMVCNRDCFRGRKYQTNNCMGDPPKFKPCQCRWGSIGRYCQYHNSRIEITFNNLSLPRWLIQAIDTQTFNSSQFLSFNRTTIATINSLLGYNSGNDISNSWDTNYTEIIGVDKHERTRILFDTMQYTSISCIDPFNTNILVKIPSTLTFTLESRTGTSMLRYYDQIIALADAFREFGTTQQDVFLKAFHDSFTNLSILRLNDDKRLAPLCRSADYKPSNLQIGELYSYAEGEPESWEDDNNHAVGYILHTLYLYSLIFISLLISIVA